MKKLLLVCVKLAVTAGVLALLLVKVRVETVIETMRLVPLPALAVAIVLTVAQPALSAARWYLILRSLGGTLSIVGAVQVYWAGVFASALLPGGITGDGVRMWMLSRAGLPASRCVNSVLLDRAAALIGLVLLVALSLPFLDDRIADAGVRYGASAAILAGLAIGLWAGLALRVPQEWQRFRAARAFVHLGNDLRAICARPSMAGAFIALSALAIACNSLTMFVLIRSLHVPVGFLDAMVLCPVVTLILTLPISFGGWGLREASMVGLFGIVGVPVSVSLSASILAGLLAMLASLPGAAVLAMMARTGHGEQVRQGERAFVAASAAKGPAGALDPLTHEEA